MPKRTPSVPDGVLYDARDRDTVEPFYWGLMTSGYVWRRVGTGSSQKRILIHRAIMQPLPHEEVDHINGNKLDNRRCNLRNVTGAINKQNRTKKNALNTSGYRGVYRAKRYNYAWRAMVTVNGKQKPIGKSNDKLFLAALASTYRTLYVEGATC